MPVYFSNPGNLDPIMLEVMGLSVKEHDNPIGKFGTGLKIAVAVLLRTGHKVRMWVDGETYTFTTRTETARGQEHQRVYMNDKALPFNTNLGREWEVWQAYRELRSNCMDEMGYVSTTMPGVGRNQTVFEVRGQEFEEVHAEAYTIFLQTQPEHTIDGVEIHEGPGKHIFYRGIRVYELPKVAVKTYNLLSCISLTEDRTLAYPTHAEDKIANAIVKAPDSFLANCALGRNEEYFERTLKFNAASGFSREFLEAAAANSVDVEAHPHARIISNALKRSHGYTRVQSLSQKRQKNLDRGVALAAKLFDSQPVCEVRVAEDLGPNVHGLYKDGTDYVWISMACLDMGVDYVAATISEEWLHRRGYEDFSRRLQDWLLQRLIQEVK